MITSPQNQHVKLARKLQRRRHRAQMGLCLLEGVRLIRDAWQAKAHFEILFVLPDLVQSNADVGALVAQIETAGVSVLLCTDEVLAAVTETVTPQGIAAVVEIPQLMPPDRPDLILVLDRLRQPGNAGTLLRSAAAAGVDLVIFGPETVDAYNGKVLRAAMGAHFRLPLRTCNQWQGVIQWLKHNPPIYLAEAGAARTYDTVNWQEPAVLVVGGEARGASAEAGAAATPIAIPMHHATESLNAAMAGSIILFEAARQRRKNLH